MSKDLELYLLVDDINNNYETYLVNDTDKKYFARLEYSEQILKPKSYISLGKVKKDRDAPALTVWITDDTSETYLLSFSNLPYYCKKRVRDKYFKKQVYKLTSWKLENCFHRVESIKVHDKYKDTLINTLTLQQPKLLDVVIPDIDKLFGHLKKYLDIYKDYDVKHRYHYLQSLVAHLRDLAIVEELETGKKSIFLKLKGMLHNSCVDLDKEFLFLNLNDEDKKDMLISVEIEGYDDNFTIDLIEYFKNQGYKVSESEEYRLDRFNWVKSYSLQKGDDNLSIDSIYFEEATYYLVLTHKEVQKYILEYIKANKKNTFSLEYIKKDEEIPFVKKKEFHSEYGY